MTPIKHPKKFNQTERTVVPKRNKHESLELDTGHELTCINCGREIPAGYHCERCKELFKARGRQGVHNVISGRLVGMDENVLRVQMANGIIAAYPYSGLNDASAIDLQCIYDNMGQSVVCLIKDGAITELNPLGARL